MKQCNKCKNEKPFSDFSKSNSRKDGYQPSCKQCVKDYQTENQKRIKEYYVNKAEQTKEYQKKYRKAYRKKNAKKLNKKGKQYREENSQTLKVKRNVYQKKKMATDPLFRLKRNTRNLIYQSLYAKGFSKDTKTAQILNCTFEEFKAYLENKFESWMTWENRGLYNGTPDYGWDLDHITPLSKAKTKEEVIKLNHFTNFQPLCSYKNRLIKKNN